MCYSILIFYIIVKKRCISTLRSASIITMLNIHSNFLMVYSYFLIVPRLIYTDKFYFYDHIPQSGVTLGMFHGGSCLCCAL